MSNNFLYDESVMSTMSVEMTKAKSIIEDTYQKANELYSNKLKNSSYWSGESYNTMLAFMDLLLQYHGKFTDNNGKSPISQAIDALEEMNTNVESFYQNSTYYRQMMGLS